MFTPVRGIDNCNTRTVLLTLLILNQADADNMCGIASQFFILKEHTFWGYLVIYKILESGAFLVNPTVS